MATDSDNFTILSSNFFRLGGVSISASDNDTLSGYYPEFAIDGNRGTTWYSASTAAGVSDSLIIDCGSTLPAAANRFFLSGNLSNYTLYCGSDNANWLSVYDKSGSAAAALHTLSDTTRTCRYWKLLCSSTITASQYRQVTQIGLYNFQYQFSDTFNPLHTIDYFESGQEHQLWNGGVWRPTVREVANITAPIRRIKSADHTTLKATWRAYRNNMAIMPEPISQPTECYDVVATPLALRYLASYKAIGYGGTMAFRSY